MTDGNLYGFVKWVMPNLVISVYESFSSVDYICICSQRGSYMLA